MKDQTIFQRYEIKYRITREQQKWLIAAIGGRMREDCHGVNTIRNVYFDTPDRRLIRRSLEKPLYKEKLRLRSYVMADETTPVFMELKKKYKGIVYKRRIALPETEAMAFLCDRQTTRESQILREMDYFLDFYGDVRPSMFLSYRRQAFYGVEDPDLRLTFDDSILWREDRLRLTEEVGGRELLPPDTVLMEIKTSTALPLWLTALLCQQHIYKSSFSKYGTAYLETVKEKKEGSLYVG